MAETAMLRYRSTGISLVEASMTFTRVRTLRMAMVAGVASFPIFSGLVLTLSKRSGRVAA
jgi:hypothetical protein